MWWLFIPILFFNQYSDGFNDKIKIKVYSRSMVDKHFITSCMWLVFWNYHTSLVFIYPLYMTLGFCQFLRRKQISYKIKVSQGRAVIKILLVYYEYRFLQYEIYSFNVEFLYLVMIYSMIALLSYIFISSTFLCCLLDYLFKSTFTMKYSVLTKDVWHMSKPVCYVNKCTIITNFCFEDREY